MNADFQHCLVYMVSAMIGYFLKSYFPNLPPLPAIPRQQLQNQPLGLTMAQLEAMLQAAARRTHEEWLATQSISKPPPR